MARQRLLSPENAAAMRTILPERTEEFENMKNILRATHSDAL